MSEKLTLHYIPYRSGTAYGNLMFEGKAFPTMGGRFHKEHPFAPGQDVFNNYPEIGVSEKLVALRKLGYYISCFPEGDGLCFAPPAGIAESEIIRDICKTLDVSLTAIVPAT